MRDLRGLRPPHPGFPGYSSAVRCGYFGVEVDWVEAVPPRRQKTLRYYAESPGRPQLKMTGDIADLGSGIPHGSGGTERSI